MPLPIPVTRITWRAASRRWEKKMQLATRTDGTVIHMCMQQFPREENWLMQWWPCLRVAEVWTGENDETTDAVKHVAS